MAVLVPNKHQSKRAPHYNEERRDAEESSFEAVDHEAPRNAGKYLGRLNDQSVDEDAEVELAEHQRRREIFQVHDEVETNKQQSQPSDRCVPEQIDYAEHLTFLGGILLHQRCFVILLNLPHFFNSQIKAVLFVDLSNERQRRIRPLSRHFRHQSDGRIFDKKHKRSHQKHSGNDVAVHKHVGEVCNKVVPQHIGETSGAETSLNDVRKYLPVFLADRLGSEG